MVQALVTQSHLQGIHHCRQSRLWATSSHLPPTLTKADWPLQPLRYCCVPFKGVVPPPAGIGAASAGATTTASAGATAIMQVPPTLPAPGSPPLLLLLSHHWNYRPSQHPEELAWLPPCSQNREASGGAWSFGRCLLTPQLVSRQMRAD